MWWCAGIAALINRINRPDITVAVDGSLYRFHPYFDKLMLQKTQDLLNPGLRVGVCLVQCACTVLIEFGIVCLFICCLLI